MARQEAWELPLPEALAPEALPVGVRELRPERGNEGAHLRAQAAW